MPKDSAQPKTETEPVDYRKKYIDCIETHLSSHIDPTTGNWKGYSQSENPITDDEFRSLLFARKMYLNYSSDAYSKYKPDQIKAELNAIASVTSLLSDPTIIADNSRLADFHTVVGSLTETLEELKSNHKNDQVRYAHYDDYRFQLRNFVEPRISNQLPSSKSD